MEEQTTAETKAAAESDTAPKTTKKRSTAKSKAEGTTKSKAASTTKAKTTTTTRKRKTASKSKSSQTKVAKAEVQATTITISDEQRLEMIAQAAYYKAEKRGFTGGDPREDWLTAESEIDALLSSNTTQQAPA